MEVRTEIAKNILFYRKKKNMSQKELAEKLGVRHTTVSAWENCKNAIDIDALNEICNILNISLNDALGKYAKKEDIKLSRDEQQLIKDYRSLSSQGKEYIRQQMYMAKNIYQEKADLTNLEDQIKGA